MTWTGLAMEESRVTANELIAAAATAVARSGDQGEVCAAIVDQAVALGGDCVYLHLSDEERGLRLHSCRGVPDTLRAALQQVPLRAPLVCARAARTREVQRLDSPAELPDEMATARALMDISGAAGLVSLPLVCGGAVLGVLTWTVRRRLPEGLDGAGLVTLATLFALALARTRVEGRAEPRPIRPIAARRRPPIPVQLQVLLDFTSNPLALLLPEGGVLRLNGRAAALLEAEPQQPQGRPLWTVPALQRTAELAASVQAAVAVAGRGETGSFPVTLRDEQGRELAFAFEVRPVADRSGKVGLLMLEGQELRSSRELDKLHGEWIAMVAHDLRQPVNSLAIWLQVMERVARRAGLDSAEASRAARASIVQLDRMIGDLLEAGRLDAGRLRLEPRALEVDELLRGILGRSGLPAEKLRLQVESNLPRVHADAARIEQVVLNLLSNAFKYGDGAAEVSAGRDRGAVRFTVVNGGPGIAPEDLPSLFQRFFRAGRRGQVDGTGLGLYIARSLVEAHAGRIWVDSAPGKTAFHFTLPAAAAEPVTLPGILH